MLHRDTNAWSASDPRPPKDQTVQVTVVLPCYNEEQQVVAEVERICCALDESDYSYEVLAIDDGSTDGTWALLEQQAREHPAVRPLRFPSNRGPGTARRLGTEWARGAVVVWTDADMTYPNERIPDLVRILDEDPSCDQVVGARTSERGSYRALRAAVKWAIRKLAELLVGAKIRDLNSGLRAFRRDAAEPYLRLLPAGFSCVTTITLAFLANHHHIWYVPVAYAPRSGKSKFRIVRDTYRLLLQVLAVSMLFSPLRVLVPVALVLVSLGVLKGGREMVLSAAVGLETVIILMTGVMVLTVALLADVIGKSRCELGRRRSDHVAPTPRSEREPGSAIAFRAPARRWNFHVALPPGLHPAAANGNGGGPEPIRDGADRAQGVGTASDPRGADGPRPSATGPDHTGADGVRRNGNPTVHRDVRQAGRVPAGSPSAPTESLPPPA
jgi:glycosyltransferase involved in cell wall biosynthesis